LANENEKEKTVWDEDINGQRTTLCEIWRSGIRHMMESKLKLNIYKNIELSKQKIQRLFVLPFQILTCGK
jgi:hypothetical protein